MFIGLSEDQFYQLSIAEYERICIAYQKRLEFDNRKNYDNIKLLSACIVGRMNKDFVFPEYEQIYGSNEQVAIDQSLTNFIKFAQANNRKYGGNN